MNRELCPSASLPLMMPRGLLSKTFSSERISHGRTKSSTSTRSKVHSKNKRRRWKLTFALSGNEDDHIIISVVRSDKPGFLGNQRRTNVMLTRCKQSMVICSSRAFLSGSASRTLVGELAASVRQNWINGNDIVCGRVGSFS